MADTAELSAVVRERVGKGAARAVRRQGLVPAVIYGDNKDPEAISMEIGVLEKELSSGSFMSTLYIIDVDGNKSQVIARDVQFDKVKDFPIHVDFLRLKKGATIAVEVQVNFLNEEESPGLKRGGVLNVVRYTVEVTCPAASIPESLDADLTGLDIGDSIHISAIPLPDGVEPTITDRDFTVATIAAPAGLDAEEEEGEDEEGLEGIEGEEGVEDGEAAGEDGEGGDEE